MNQDEKAKEYEQILERAKNDSRVIGLILTGGRGKGMFTENSDYDVAIVATDESAAAVAKEYTGKQDVVDIRLFSLSDFRNHAAVGSADDWDRYTYAHIKAQIDKTEEIQKIIDEKGVLPQDQALKVAKHSLGGYLNSLYRSMKNYRDGNTLAAHFDGCESMPWLLTFLFAVEGAIRPYNKFLKWELEKYPLINLPIPAVDFLRKIEMVLSSGDIEAQKELHKIVEEIAAKSGCSAVIEDWGGYYFG